MNPKQMKFLKQFASLSRVDAVTDSKAFLANMKAFLELDFMSAVDVWEFMTTDKEGTLAEDKEVATVFADKVFDMLSKKNGARTVKTVLDTPSIRRAVFQYSPSADKGIFFDIAVDIAVNAKVAVLDEILKCMAKNTSTESTFGQYMKHLIERLFIEILKKSPTKQIYLNKKMTTLLLSHISKIKTEERPLLEQRIREIS
ncbi:MAG: hypothetical protein HFK09_03945 [Clostridia bacterium]|nr:hypothetical protein [Clostridia bacterium]